MTEKCEVYNCEEDAVRSIPKKRLMKYLPELKLKRENVKRVHICKTHYKTFKKKSKKDREFERLAWQ